MNLFSSCERPPAIIKLNKILLPTFINTFQTRGNEPEQQKLFRMSIKNLKIEGQVLQLTIFQSRPKDVMDRVKQQSRVKELQEEIISLREKAAGLRLQLQKQGEINFILKGYFGKVEKIMYSQQSHLFDANPIDYQKIELHMREILRRLNDIHNEKLNSTPVIYRKDNLKIYRHTLEKSPKEK